MIPMETLKEKKKLAHRIQKDFQETFYSQSTEIRFYIKSKSLQPCAESSICIGMCQCQ